MFKLGTIIPTFNKMYDKEIKKGFVDVWKVIKEIKADINLIKEHSGIVSKKKKEKVIVNEKKENKISPDFIGDKPETMKEGTITPKENKDKPSEGRTTHDDVRGQR